MLGIFVNTRTIIILKYDNDNLSFKKLIKENMKNFKRTCLMIKIYHFSELKSRIKLKTDLNNFFLLANQNQ